MAERPSNLEGFRVQVVSGASAPTADPAGALKVRRGRLRGRKPALDRSGTQNQLVGADAGSTRIELEYLEFDLLAFLLEALRLKRVREERDGHITATGT